MTRNLIATFRQWLYPREFRIEEMSQSPEWQAALIDVAQMLRAIAAREPPVTSDENDKAMVRALCDLANGVWRLKTRMIDGATGRPKEQFRREYSHVESLWDVLAEAGIEIQDHTGQRVSPGLSLREIERIPVLGLSHARVQETIKPTIYFKGNHVQKGEVIVEEPVSPVQ